MVLDGTLTDTEVSGDVLAGLAGEDHVHDLALPRRQADQAVGRGLSPRKECIDQQILFTQLRLCLGKRLAELHLGHRTGVTRATTGMIDTGGTERDKNCR